MKRKRPAKKVMTLAATLVAVVGLLFFAVVSPETRLSYWLFRCVYASSVSKKSLLETYRSNLWTFEGGYIPELTDQFLCSRLEVASSQAEVDAISNFYTLQASGREGKGVISLSDGARQKVVASIMQNLDGYDVWQVERAVLLVEEMRRGEEIWKGAFRPENAQKSGNWTEWWKKTGSHKVKALYRKWWQSQQLWSVKQTQNPLVDSGIEATSL